MRDPDQEPSVMRLDVADRRALGYSFGCSSCGAAPFRHCFHRGRLHGTRRRLPEGTKIEWTRELQEDYIKTANWRLGVSDGEWLLERYCRNQPAGREVSAA